MRDQSAQCRPALTRNEHPGERAHVALIVAIVDADPVRRRDVGHLTAEEVDPDARKVEPGAGRMRKGGVEARVEIGDDELASLLKEVDLEEPVPATDRNSLVTTSARHVSSGTVSA